MSVSKTTVIGTLLLLIVLFAVAITLLQFRFAANNIERVAIDSSYRQEENKFDRLLTTHLARITKTGVLDSMLTNTEHGVYINNVAISRCQVSQGQYNAFGQWLQFSNRSNQIRHPEAPEDEKLVSRFLQHRLLGRRNAPVTGVTYYQASAYCRAAGGRLPTKDEWEAVASGKQKRLYPWGDEFKAGLWRYSNPLLNVINHCETYPESATPEGVLDMGNSVSEWSIDDNSNAVLKGGNAFNRPFSLHALNVVDKRIPKDFSSQFVGFRCIFDNEDATSKTLPWGEQHIVIPIDAGNYTLGVPADARLPKILAPLSAESIEQLAPTMITNQSQRHGYKAQVSRYEITVSEYSWFLRDPLVRIGYYANELQPAGHSHVPDDWDEQKLNSQAPVTGVSWWDAYAFSSWAGGRLPRVNEWNSWYGGKNRFIYPWGDKYQKNLALVRDSSNDTQSIHAVNESQDINDFGLIGLAGNVSEWTSSLYMGSGEQTMIIKGGNFILDGEQSARVDYIARAPLYHRSKAIGFRVVFQ